MKLLARQRRCFYDVRNPGAGISSLGAKCEIQWTVSMSVVELSALRIGRGKGEKIRCGGIGREFATPRRLLLRVLDATYVTRL